MTQDYYAFEGGVSAVPSPNIPISEQDHAEALAALAVGRSVSIANGFEIITPITLASLSPGRNVGIKPTDVVDLNVSALMSRRIGYAKDVVGGLDGDVFIVDTLAETGPTSIRAALEITDPLWIVPVVVGVVNLTSDLIFNSFTTIDGRAGVLRFDGKKLVAHNCEEIILCNFHVLNSDNDAFGTAYSDMTWCVNLSLALCDDGLIDITRAREDLPLSRHTITACRMTVHDKCSLVGLHEGEWDDRIRVTYNRNWMQCTQRHPRVAKARVHAFNNVVRYSGQGMQCYDEGQLLSQGNWLQRMTGGNAAAHSFEISGQDNGYISSGGDVVSGGAVIAENEIGLVASPGYPYSVAPMNSTLRDQVFAGSGAVLTL